MDKRPRPEDGTIVARAAALRLIDAVTAQHRPLTELTEAPGGPLDGLGPADRARAQRLALATLRRIGPVDSLLAPLVRRRPRGRILALLRLAATELALEPAAAHGIVDSAVRLARAEPGGAAMAGFVNAVLRRLAAAGPTNLPPQRMPDWLRRPVVATWGEAVAAAIEAAHAAGAPLDLTPREPGEAAALAARLAGRLLPTGSIRIAPAPQVSALPGYDDGAWWVQDAAAALPVRLLAPRPGERVLDLCAAPGGKTLQLAAAGARVTALDASPARMRRLSENLARCRLEAACMVADARDWPAAGEPFDAVLVDAPCTATGTIRRHPDLPFVRGPDDLGPLTALQARLIDRAVALTRPGGRILFCTCSLLPAEGEAQLTAALARHPGLRVLPDRPAGMPEAWSSPAGGFRLRPDHWTEHGGIDGFFIALLERS